VKSRVISILACVILVAIGASTAYRYEMKARRIERSIKQRRAENLAEVPVIEAKLDDQSISDAERMQLEGILSQRQKGMPHAPGYFPYNERITGWPIGSAFMLGGIACLFVKLRKESTGADCP